MVQVVDSGWTEPLPIDSGAAASTGESSSKPVMIRARIPQWGSVHELVARLDLVGSSFGRTLVSTTRAATHRPLKVSKSRCGSPWTFEHTP